MNLPNFLLNLLTLSAFMIFGSKFQKFTLCRIMKYFFLSLFKPISLTECTFILAVRLDRFTPLAFSVPS